MAAKETDNEGGLTRLETARVVSAREQAKELRTTPRLPQNKAASLLVMGGPLKGKTFPISKPQVLLGRAGADIVVPDAMVSRKHCVIEVHGNRALLVDLDSANGTFVDNKRISSCELSHLSEFRIGDTTLMFALTGSQGIALNEE
ncbi:MAG TPA: FHA domain-containing protein [Terriglobia bacterium]|jgi:S-DNA-T family DNA segregation ATPase FtsK/SpoIIIE